MNEAGKSKKPKGIGGAPTRRGGGTARKGTGAAVSRKSKTAGGAGGPREVSRSQKRRELKRSTKTAAFGGPSIRKIINRLENAYPDSKIALRFTNPLELLVATILAAQCTDERVNLVTKDLFKKYRKPADYARASLGELMEAVHPTGFFRNKSRSIQAACRVIAQRHGGVVPDTMEGLLELPGVARKTANVVLANAYGVASGIAVDTHMLRVAKRLGLTHEKDPVKVERDLCEIVPEKHWIHFPHLIMSHGRAVCKARSPLCAGCVLEKLCPSRDLFIEDVGPERKTSGRRMAK